MQLLTTYAAHPSMTAMAHYCWAHQTAHQLQIDDVEVLVATLGAMVVDGYKLGEDTTRHAPDCLLDVIRLGRDSDGYAEHTDQAVAGRVAADPVSMVIEAVPAGEQLDAERRGEQHDETCPWCPKQCRSCPGSRSDCECYEHQPDPNAPTPLDRGPGLPDAEAGADQ